MENSTEAKKIKTSMHQSTTSPQDLESKTKLSVVMKIEFLDTYNPEVVQQKVVRQLQASIMAADGVEDPILVFKADHKYYVIDGKHRLAALREIASQASDTQSKLISAKKELEALEQNFKSTLQSEVNEAFEAYRKDHLAKGKPVGTKKEQECFRETLFASAVKKSASLSTKERKLYFALLAILNGDKKKTTEDLERNEDESSKAKVRSILDWQIPFKILPFDSLEKLDKHYQKNLKDIDKSRAHDLNKVNHLIDKYEIFKNRADNDRWSFQKVADYYKTDISTVNRVMQLRHVEISIRKFITDNEGADLQKSKDHRHRLKLSHVYRHLSKAGSNKDVVEVDPSKISNYPPDGTVKEKNTAAVLEFIKHEALHGKPHPGCNYIGKTKTESKEDADVGSDDSPTSRFDIEALIKWGKSHEKYRKAQWGLIHQMFDDFQKSRR